MNAFVNQFNEYKIKMKKIKDIISGLNDINAGNFQTLFIN